MVKQEFISPVLAYQVQNSPSKEAVSIMSSHHILLSVCSIFIQISFAVFKLIFIEVHIPLFLKQ